MKLRNTSRYASGGRYWLVAAALAASGGAQAFNFQLFDNAVDGSFDTTVGYGIALRTEDPQPGNLSGQYGNRYLFQDKWDVVTNMVKASHELQLNGGPWSAFVRGNYFYDAAMDHQNLPNASRARAVSHGDITDAYFLTRFGSNDQFTARVGKQVISWGENTFIGGALNDINTVDITRVRQPGVELKDALTGTDALYGSWAINPAFTFEAFWLLNFDELKIDPMGSFYDTLDLASDGGGFATGVDKLGRPVALAPDGQSTGLDLGTIPITRASDKRPSSAGQFGAALRYYAPNLGNGFDFGLYYERLNDHNPQLSSIAGTPLHPGRYFVTYADAVERYGASFNTTVGPWAVSGEYSWRRNAPIQGLGFATVAALGTDLVKGYAPGTVYQGYQRYERNQIQFTGQRLWGPMPMFKADQWNTIGEIAYGWVGDMPGIDLNGHATPASTAALAAAAHAGGGFVRFDDMTPSFWGFQARSTLTYNNILFNRINMDFNTSFRWDVDGVSPELGGAKLFYRGRKAVTLGVAFDYALRWKLGINQTFFTGGQDEHRPNGTTLASSNDRDFLAIDLSYTF
jgi:hypothetical protein